MSLRLIRRVRPALRRRAAAASSLLLAAPLLAATEAPPAAAADATRHITYRDWSGTAELASGTHRGTRAVQGELRMAHAVGTRRYAGVRYEHAVWLSPWVGTPYGFTELIPSWNARTPGRSWMQVDVRAVIRSGATSKWYVMSRWTPTDRWLKRTSAGPQGDPLARVAVDTLRAQPGRRFVRWQVRVTLLRPVGGAAVPRVQQIGAVASRLPAGDITTASPLGGAQGQVLPVPTYSQQLHRGHYPQWGGGGEAWCSPTSTSMVLRFWKTGPRPQEYGWVGDEPNPWVDHAARGTFDYGYDGTGNWPFNTAYAGLYGTNAFVTRLRSLTEAERFIRAGIPLVASLSFSADELSGAGYGTNGHLLVIVGFDSRGNVVVNDPASHLKASNAEVRTTYNRRQFENAWLPHSGGLVYVIAPTGKRLPAPPRQANW